MLTQHARLLLQSQLEICWNDAVENKRIAHKLNALLSLVNIVEPFIKAELETTPIWKTWEKIDDGIVPEHVVCEALLRKLTGMLFESFDWDNDSEWTLRAKTEFEAVTNRIIHTEYYFNNARSDVHLHLGRSYIDNLHGILKESLRLLDALDSGVDPHDMVEKGI